MIAPISIVLGTAPGPLNDPEKPARRFIAGRMVLIVFLNLLVDIAYAWLDPKVRNR